MFSPALGPTQPPIPLDKAAGARSCHYPHPVLWTYTLLPQPPRQLYLYLCLCEMPYQNRRIEQIMGSSPLSPEYRPLAGPLCPLD